MTRDQKIRIAMIICGTVLACAVIITATGMFSGTSVGGYANADKYTAGDTEITGKVRNLDIGWVSGKVTVAYHGKDTVSVSETSGAKLGEDQKLRWWLDGDTLRIRFAKPGIRLSHPNKELTVALPEGTVPEEIDISVTSADTEITGLKAKTLKLGGTSGTFNASAEAEEVTAGTTSGDINLQLTGKTERIEAAATSGRIRIEAEKAGEIKAGATSGDIEISAEESGRTEVDSTSAGATIRLKKLGEVSVSTVSGTAVLQVPSTPGFRAEVSTVSGRTEMKQAVTQQGNTYTCGDGSGKIHITTVSGDIRIEEAK